LGSSLKYPDYWQQYHGILSDNPDNYFRNWTIVYLKYCTGTGHQGYRSDPIEYKNTKLYFRGHNVTISMLDHLNNKFGLFNASDIVVTGQSAGGLATYLWTNYIYDRAILAGVKNIWSIPDSGIFLD
jgi:hypothetical protein